VCEQEIPEEKSERSSEEISGETPDNGEENILESAEEVKDILIEEDEGISEIIAFEEVGSAGEEDRPLDVIEVKETREDEPAFGEVYKETEEEIAETIEMVEAGQPLEVRLEKPTQLSFDQLERGDTKKELVVKNPEFKVKSFMDVEAMRVEEVKLPIDYGSEDDFPKKNLLSTGGITLSVLGQKLYNFKLLREEGRGRRKIQLKGRECKITFEGTINPNGSIGLPKMLSYHIVKDLSFKRAIDVYTFIEKVLAGNEITISGRDIEEGINIPQRFEYIKILKIVDILYKYNSILKRSGLDSGEKVEFVLKNARKINQLSFILNERRIDTMVSLEGESLNELVGTDVLKIQEEGTLKLKKFKISFVKEVEIPEFILKTQDEVKKMSISWKKAKISYKKVLD